MKSTSTVLMIRPVNFGFNVQTADSNAFQKKGSDPEQVQVRAVAQFDDFVAALRNNGITVLVIDDTLQPHTPDSIFPNNWISTHENGDIFLYPMAAMNRRLERRADIIDLLKKDFKVNNVYDLSYFEDTGRFLEGTGSMVLDRESRIAYACISSRTDVTVLGTFCLKAGYTPFPFQATDRNGVPVYHTNVMMNIGRDFAVICLESIANFKERAQTKKMLEATGNEIIEITHRQLSCFAGNIIQLENKSKESLIVMSDTAFNCLSHDQRSRLQNYGTLLHVTLDAIEKTGGGSARCMIAEIYLPHCA